MPLTTSQIQLSFDMGGKFLLRQQRSDGTFNYEYNWKEKSYTSEDNSVRQAGTLWGLALTHQHNRDPRYLDACIRGLEFFEKHSSLTPSGGRFVSYPGERHGLIGAVALLTLALIELLRPPTSIDGGDGDRFRLILDEYIRFLIDSRNPHGLWHSRYDQKSGRAHGKPSAFFDGEALLALTKATKYLDYGHLQNLVLKAAASGFRHNMLLALRSGNSRRRIAQGYYQWGLMSFCEIVESAWPDADQYIEPVFYLADMRAFAGAPKNNRGAVLEGLIHAYGVASTRDKERSQKYRDRIVRDLGGMLSLQVNNPAAVEFISGAEADDMAVGGFQHYPETPTLRIDFTQHSLHAMLLGIERPDLFV